MLKAVVILAGACGLLMAEEAARYSGSWVLRKDSNVKLVLKRDGDSIHVQETKGNEVRADFTCTLTGKDCDVKEDGKKSRVSLWFNGGKLLELVTRGDVVTKRRFTLTDQGSTLEEEVLPMAPPGKAETIAYSREQ